MSQLMTTTRQPMGNIKPSRFVKQDTANQGGVLAATDGSGSAGDPVFGISQKSVWQVPLGVPGGATVLDDGYAGTAVSPPITVFMDGAECYIVSGAAFAIDDALKSDSDGRGITASSSGDNIGAIALEAATAAGQLRKVRVKTRIKV